MKIQRAILRNISLYQQALEKSLSNLNFMDPGGVDEERDLGNHFHPLVLIGWKRNQNEGKIHPACSTFLKSNFLEKML